MVFLLKLNSFYYSRKTGKINTNAGILQTDAGSENRTSAHKPRKLPGNVKKR